MGKRKKAAKKPGAPKQKEKLASTFQCLFCNHENSVIVSIDKKSGVGNLNCKVCGQAFQTPVNYLSAAVDVYADWIDACDAVAKEEAAQKAPASRIGAPSRAHRVEEEEEEEPENDDDRRFRVDDEIDAEGEYDEDE